MRNVLLKDGTPIPALGQGTWYMGEKRSLRDSEIESLRWGIEHGMNLIDTAEMYGDGASEELIGDAIVPFDREKLFIVSKVYPWNAGRRNIFDSCEASLERLGTDYLDLYLLHWREDADLAEMCSLMEEARTAGKIREWGVSNFDTADMEDLLSVKYGENCRVNQIFYNPLHRGIEFDLMPWQKEKDIRLMSYSTLDRKAARSTLLEKEEIRSILETEHIPVEALMLAFNIHHDVCALFQTKSVTHLKDNLKGLTFDISPYMEIIDRACPPPSAKVPMEKR